MLDIEEDGSPRDLHVLDGGTSALRWRALFSSPVFHNTVVLDRQLFEEHGLRYDTSFGETEDYDLWTRALAVMDGDCVEEPLVLHRLHPAQASRRRGDLQRSLAEKLSLRQITGIAPELAGRRAWLARAVGLGEEVAAGDVEEAASAFVTLLHRFEAEHQRTSPVRQAAARALVRLAQGARGPHGASILAQAARLDAGFPARVASRRRRRALARRRAASRANALMRSLEPPSEVPIRVTAVFPEPTPYRAPLLDRVAALPEIDLTVVYAADTVARRTWRIERTHRAVFLDGVRVPGADRVLHHDYPVTPGVVRELHRQRPDVVVVSGWSTFAAQAALAWCTLRDVPYLLVVESHDEGPRAGWRKKVKGAVVPPVVTRAAGVLVTGTLARNSMLARGARPERVRVFANTIDVAEFGKRSDRLAPKRAALRAGLGAGAGLGIGADDVIVLSVARLVREKGLDQLLRAVALAGGDRIVTVIAGDGPERPRLEGLARELGLRAVFTGDVDWERVVELYVAADVFALLSEREPWAVVVNEAAACGLPLVLSDRVGAAHDLLRDGENGVLVPAGDVDAAASALRELAADETHRQAQGARSRELARDWGYGPSVDGFLAAVREAAGDRS